MSQFLSLSLSPPPLRQPNPSQATSRTHQNRNTAYFCVEFPLFIAITCPTPRPQLVAVLARPALHIPQPHRAALTGHRVGGIF